MEKAEKYRRNGEEGADSEKERSDEGEKQRCDRRVVEKEERGEGRGKGGRDIQEQQTDGQVTRYRGKNGEGITGS